MALYDTLVRRHRRCCSPPRFRSSGGAFGAGYGLFMLLNLCLPLSSGAFEGLGRYCSVLFPAFIWLATIRSRFVSIGVVVVFAMFYTLGPRALHDDASAVLKPAEGLARTSRRRGRPNGTHAERGHSRAGLSRRASRCCQGARGRR